MLVLSRKPNESVSIGHDIRITVIRTTSGGVRLGIEAPPDVKIVRSELQDRNTLPDLLNEAFAHPWGRPEDDVPRRIHEAPVVDEALPARHESASL